MPADPATSGPTPATDPRFGGIARLVGTQRATALAAARICVVGIGGVGGWVVEALARSGVGAIGLVDLDEVCASNINRQIHALGSTVGRSKIEVMAARIADINPQCSVHEIPCFFTPATADHILDCGWSVVVDACDSLAAKCHLIALCKARGIACVTCGGAGGRWDPTQIRISDLAKTRDDPLLLLVRKKLRRDHGFTRDERKPFGVPCVHSLEWPQYLQADGTVAATKPANGETRINCDFGLGTATPVCGAFGFALARAAMDLIGQP
jgi:tRNA threonylcarbamoyladenosine dehydratase